MFKLNPFLRFRKLALESTIKENITGIRELFPVSHLKPSLDKASHERDRGRVYVGIINRRRDKIPQMEVPR